MYLSTGLALILGFIGVKLVLHFFHLQNEAVPEISTGASLIVIAKRLGLPSGQTVRNKLGGWGNAFDRYR